MAYISLFLTAFLAATVLPLSSEVLLATFIYQGHLPLMLWLAATAGNTLGSCVNWLLGRECLRWQDKKWFPCSPEQLQRAQLRFQRYGQWTLLFAWVPVIGDPLTLIAGVMRVKFLMFFALVLIGKAARYAVIIFISVHTFSS